MGGAGSYVRRDILYLNPPERTRYYPSKIMETTKEPHSRYIGYEDEPRLKLLKELKNMCQ